MRVLSVLPILALTACGSSQFATLEIPNHTETTRARMAAFCSYIGQETECARLRGVLEVVNPDELVNGTATTSHLGPDTVLIQTDYNSIPHELTHALYGDHDHARKQLWAAVDAFNGWLPGHAPPEPF